MVDIWDVRKLIDLGGWHRGAILQTSVRMPAVVLLGISMVSAGVAILCYTVVKLNKKANHFGVKKSATKIERRCSTSKQSEQLKA